jgi:hypothetical protein
VATSGCCAGAIGERAGRSGTGPDRTDCARPPARVSFLLSRAEAAVSGVDIPPSSAPAPPNTVRRVWEVRRHGVYACRLLKQSPVVGTGLFTKPAVVAQATRVPAGWGPTLQPPDPSLGGCLCRRWSQVARHKPWLLSPTTLDPVSAWGWTSPRIGGAQVVGEHTTGVWMGSARLPRPPAGARPSAKPAR